MDINWYPGHMKKATDAVKRALPQVQLCLEIRDARIPRSSANQQLGALVAHKKRIIILNKKDLADRSETDQWIRALNREGQIAMALDATDEHPAERIYQAAAALLAEKRDARAQRKIINQEIRMMVFGIPNSGKSTVINAMAKRRTAKVGDRPGITTTEQWIRTDAQLLLLDTPGILPTKLEPEQALHLAFTGAIRDTILPQQDIGLELIRLLMQRDPDVFRRRYGIEATKPLEAMEQIGRSIGALLRGGEIEYTRTALRVVDDFRKLRYGAMTLETVKDLEHEARSLDS